MRVHVCVTWCKSCGYSCCGLWFQFPHIPMLLLALSASQLSCQISGKVRMTHCSGWTICLLAFSIYIKGLCHLSHYMSISIGALLPCLQLNFSPFSQQYYMCITTSCAIIKPMRTERVKGSWHMETSEILRFYDTFDNLVLLE